MWNPIKIEFENLFSHKNSKYSFANGKCVVISGENKTDRSLDNNGAGKTTLFEAICIALTNESLRNIRKDEFINEEADSCKIVFDMENPVLNKRVKIVRQFFRGAKTTRVEIWENDVQNTQIVSVLEANKRVFELLGISKEDLLRYYIISQDNHYTFFTASDVEKKEIMNRITSADMIQPVMAELKRRKDEVVEELGFLNAEIIKIDTRIETLEAQEKEILENDNTDYEIKRLMALISDKKESIELRRGERESLGVKLTALNKELKELGGEIDLSTLYEVRKNVRAKINEVESVLSDSERIKSKIEREIDGKVTCPDCGSEFLPKSELGITYQEALELVKDSEREISNVNNQLKQLNKRLSKANSDINDAEEKEKKRNSLIGCIDKANDNLSRCDSADEYERGLIKKYEGEIEDLRNKQKDNSAIKTIRLKIEHLKNQLAEKESAMNKVRAAQEMISFWEFNMGKSGFTTYLANHSVKIIEGITNSFLRKFGVDISVLINGFKVLKSGEVREKIDVFVTNDGISFKPFMAKSGGERGRVMLAGVLGIQHLINMSTNGKGMNMLLLDECFSGMDAVGQENVIKIFERMGITIMVITQNVGDGFNNENTLRVVKENGVSRYC